MNKDLEVVLWVKNEIVTKLPPYTPFLLKKSILESFSADGKNFCFFQTT